MRPVDTPVMLRRHQRSVRVTHWLTTLAFVALLVSGGEILLSHPRFYWGETGNVEETPLFTIPVPSSRSTVPTGYDYVLPDQNGWSRYLHFQSAWLLGLTGADGDRPAQEARKAVQDADPRHARPHQRERRGPRRVLGAVPASRVTVMELGLNDGEFAALFPFHVAFDANGTILQVGVADPILVVERAEQVGERLDAPAADVRWLETARVLTVVLHVSP